METRPGDKSRTAGNSRDGFTLIELMFAVVIVSISVLALYQMFVTGSQLITEEYHRRIGLEKAQAKMELMKYYETQLDSVPLHMRGTYFEDLTTPERGQNFSIQAEYTITIDPSIHRDRNGVPLNYDVDLLYRWMERSGREQQIRLKSIF